MATNISSDIYQLSDYINKLQSKFMNIQEDTLSLGMFGYLSEVNSSMLQNSVIMASEYANESIPVKAKFEKNIITHALSLGINKINATPATMDIWLVLPESMVLERMINDNFTLYRDIRINIEDYEYHLDYDIIIHKQPSPTDNTPIYTAQYDNKSINNPLSDITNPYLPPIGRISNGNENLLVLTCTIRQVEYSKIYKKILTDNPIENRTITFTYESQLASFDVEVVEGNKTIRLTPIYDGLQDYSVEYFCNYNYIDANTIRIKFNKDSYEPKINCDVTVNLYQTQGSDGNFTYKDDVIIEPESEYFNYDNMYMLIRPLSDSAYGIDKKSISDIKKIIPKEALSRGNITNLRDLNNFFNSIDNDNCKLYFYKKRDNQLERLYYSYMLFKNDNIIMPTNTLDVYVNPYDFDVSTENSLVLKPGNIIQYSKNMANATIITEPPAIEYDSKGNVIESVDESGDPLFTYVNPFMCVINKNPLHISYFLNIINTNKYVTFDYINNKSKIQFISQSALKWKREYFTDRDTYKLDIPIAQNINNDFGLVQYDEQGNIINSDVRVFAVFYNKDGTPLRYAEAELQDFDSSEFVYNFRLSLTTNDEIDNANRIKINGLYDIGTTNPTYGFMTENVKTKLFVVTKLPEGRYGVDNIDTIVPGLGDYTLANTYEINNGLDFFYNYTHIMTSALKLYKNDSDRIKTILGTSSALLGRAILGYSLTDGSADRRSALLGNALLGYAILGFDLPNMNVSYGIRKMPLIRYDYINSEERVQSFIRELGIRKNYIEYCLEVLEDSFGIDMKFFNTYGPSEMFQIRHDNTVKNIDRVNLSLEFNIKLVNVSDKYIKDYIINDIKEYIEDINEITDLHIPNLITQITNTYREQLVYFEFVSINGYGPGSQHIYNPDDDIGTRVPEFLNINTLDTGTPDIKVVIM